MGHTFFISNSKKYLGSTGKNLDAYKKVPVVIFWSGYDFLLAMVAFFGFQNRIGAAIIMGNGHKLLGKFNYLK